ncbi:unnamed protein product [Caenorhabditis auriculariae]|uniref:Uncharacterized protein n=1 Tax=Caenorhabditis auriculariae TaxID=2777116 RepID=A0A8S1HGW1_9PELO|nr:unnamed protein product [Caenorhabditis auriculariae]
MEAQKARESVSSQELREHVKNSLGITEVPKRRLPSRPDDQNSAGDFYQMSSLTVQQPQTNETFEPSKDVVRVAITAVPLFEMAPPVSEAPNSSESDRAHQEDFQQKQNASCGDEPIPTEVMLKADDEKWKTPEKKDTTPSPNSRGGSLPSIGGFGMTKYSPNTVSDTRGISKGGEFGTSSVNLGSTLQPSSRFHPLAAPMDVDPKQKPLSNKYVISGCFDYMACDVQKFDSAKVLDDWMNFRNVIDSTLLKTWEFSIPMDVDISKAKYVQYEDRCCQHTSLVVEWLLDNEHFDRRRNADDIDFVVNSSVLETIMNTLYKPSLKWTMRAHSDVKLTKDGSTIFLNLESPYQFKKQLNNAKKKRSAQERLYFAKELARKRHISNVGKEETVFRGASTATSKIFRHTRTIIEGRDHDPITLLVNGEVEAHTSDGAPVNFHIMTSDSRRILSSSNTEFWESECRRLWNAAHWTGVREILFAINEKAGEPISRIEKVSAEELWEHRNRWPGGDRRAKLARSCVTRVLLAIREMMRARRGNRAEFNIKVAYQGSKNGGHIKLSYDDSRYTSFWYEHEKWLARRHPLRDLTTSQEDLIFGQPVEKFQKTVSTFESAIQKEGNNVKEEVLELLSKCRKRRIQDDDVSEDVDFESCGRKAAEELDSEIISNWPEWSSNPVPVLDKETRNSSSDVSRRLSTDSAYFSDSSLTQTPAHSDFSDVWIEKKPDSVNLPFSSSASYAVNPKKNDSVSNFQRKINPPEPGTF